MEEKSTDEVLQKIGRNMMLFQQLEHLLKCIIANGSISGSITELENIKAKQVAVISKQTMGQLVTQFVENAKHDPDSEADEAEDADTAHFSFRFQMTCDSNYHEIKKEALSNLVSERNELVHHLLPQFDPNSPESRGKIAEKLDIQSEKIRSEIKEMREIANTLLEARKQLAEYWGSDEALEHLNLAHLRSTKLVLLLCQIAEEIQRSDGWTLMTHAGQLVKKYAADELVDLKQRYGYKSLKELILATEIFDLFEEATESGGIRVLFKLKPGWYTER